MALPRIYNYRPDIPDHNDYRFSNIRQFETSALPRHYSIFKHAPPVVDQGNLGSCTANAIASCVYYDLKQSAALEDFQPSRLFIYYQERFLQGTVDSDSGASVRIGMKACHNYGTPHEVLWPYDVSYWRTKPSAFAYEDGLKFLASSYFRLDNTKLHDLKDCIYQGFPFVFGFSVYESFEKIESDGIMPMPAPTEKNLGGHCVWAGAYNDKRKAFKCRNSWGSDWGINGNFWMPYEFIMNPDYAMDFWTLRSID